MRAMNRSSSYRYARRAASVLLALAASAVWSSAQAGLGESADSVARDHSTLHGRTLVRTASTAYDRHEITLASGTRVREYVSKEGKVFAVSWSGPTLPDLKTVLAGQYDAFVKAASAPHHNHHVLTVSTPELEMQNTRLQRGFAGHAHIPKLVPAGTSVAELN